MKRYIILSFIAASALLFASCEQESQPTYPNGELPIFNGYMQFSTEVSTRSDLATNMRGRNFGVLGYHYSATSNWNTAKSITSANEFYKLEVSCGEDGGVCTYDINTAQAGNQLKPWEKFLYTFFAYYPYSGNGLSFSAQNKVDTPTLTYTYSWKGKTSLPIYYDASNQEMFDLMTAEAIDEDGSSNVDLNFKHRLFAVEVLANNYNETLYEYVYDLTKPIWVYEVDKDGNYVLDESGNPIIATDENNNPIQETDADGNKLYEVKLDENGNKVYKLDENGNKILVKDENQIINKLVVKVEGLAYHSMTIPLSMQPGEADIIYEGTPNANNNGLLTPLTPVNFQIQNKQVDVPAFNEGGNGIPTSVSKNGSDNGNGYLMFIPQGPHTDIEDKYTDHDYTLTFTVSWNGKDNSSHTDTVESSMDFIAGKLYQIIINYVGDGITIALIEAGAWDYQDVYHTFE